MLSWALRGKRLRGHVYWESNVTCISHGAGRLKLFRPLRLCCFLLLNSIRFCKDPKRLSERQSGGSPIIFDIRAQGQSDGWIRGHHASIDLSILFIGNIRTSTSTHSLFYCLNYRHKSILPRADQHAHLAWNGSLGIPHSSFSAFHLTAIAFVYQTTRQPQHSHLHQTPPCGK